MNISVYLYLMGKIEIRESYILDMKSQKESVELPNIIPIHDIILRRQEEGQGFVRKQLDSSSKIRNFAACN